MNFQSSTVDFLFPIFNCIYDYLGASLGALSTGRVSITMICSMYLTLATVIALRYTAVRKQFGPTPQKEWPVIEYQVQVFKIFMAK